LMTNGEYIASSHPASSPFIPPD